LEVTYHGLRAVRGSASPSVNGDWLSQWK